MLAATVVGVALLPAVAQADPVLTTTSTDTVKASPSGSTALHGLSVTDSNADDILQVTVSTDVGTLSLTDDEGLTLAYGNSLSGDSSITFTATPADANRGLASVQIQPGEDHAGETARVGVAALVSQPGYVYSAANEHFYEWVPSDGITWDQANVQAAERTFNGQQGYLATIPNSTVNDLVSSKIEGAQQAWFGARADQTPSEPVARTWRWVGGPLAGDPVSYCSNFEYACDFINNTGLYSSWSWQEPNNAGAYVSRSGWEDPACNDWWWMGGEYPDSCWDDSTPLIGVGGENAAVTNWGSIGQWNDLPSTNGAAGYVVEYGDQPVGSTSFAGIASDTSSVSIEGPPAAPADVTAQRGNRRADVSFTTPADNGSPITGYTVSATAGQDTSIVACTSSPCTVTGLNNGTGYSFTVRATNVDGDSPESDPATATPSTVPSVPKNVSAERGDQNATITFGAPDSDGGAPVSGYTVTAGQPGGPSATCLGSPCLVDGLSNNSPYTFTVHATNVAGDSAESDPSEAVVPAGVPWAPTEVTAERGNGSATVSFDAPGSNGSPIIGYTVTTQPGGSTTSCDGSPCSITGLTNGSEYTFTVHALNEIGTGLESGATQPVTPATVPDAPGTLEATRGDGRIDLTFHAPVFDGGSPITGYEYSLNDGASWDALDTSGSDPITATVQGLSNGTTYSISVRALNDQGHSEASVPGDATPAKAPDAPTDVTATRGEGTASVTFTTGEDNGSAITGYTVVPTPGGATTSCPASPCLVSGLTNGTSYTFRVVSSNDAGDSDPSSPSAAVVPVAPPTAPQNVVLSSQNGAALLSFDPASSDASAPVTGYEYSLDAGDSWQSLTTSGTGPITSGLTGLTNGTDYSILVRARNEIAVSGPSAAAHVRPAGPPGSPRDITTAVHGTTVDVHWSAPTSDGGSPVTSYSVATSPGASSCTTTATSCTITGLVPRTSYSFVVSASNQRSGWSGTGQGPGSTSALTRVTPQPGTPQDLQVVRGDRALRIWWTAPDNQGTTPVSSWVVSIDGGRHWARTTAIPATGTGRSRPSLRRWAIVQEPVRNGASYSVRVRAVNRAGSGAATAPVDVRTAQWFHDPISAAARRQEVGVPAHPRRYRGPVRHTTATARSHDGSPAVSAMSLRGRKLQSGQAVNFGLGPLFTYNSTVLSPQGRTAIKAMVPSLRWVTAVTCEGYADYGGRQRWEDRLAQQRGVVVCRALRSYGAHVATKVRAYGSSTPVVIGGDRAHRAPNRRVVVRITRG